MSEQSSSVPMIRITEEMTVSSLGAIFAASGMFKDARSAPQAIVKIIAGQEMGLAPIEAMRNLYVYEGNVHLSSGLMAARIQQHPQYNYRVIESTKERCELEFWGYQPDWDHDPNQSIWQVLGRSTWTIEEAREAGLLSKDNWKKYQEDMLFSRALSRGAKKYCQSVFGGPVYAIGEEVATEPLATDPLKGETISEQLRAVAEEAEVIEEDPEADLKKQLDDEILELEDYFQLSMSQASGARVKYLGTAFLGEAPVEAKQQMLAAMRARKEENEQKAKAEAEQARIAAQAEEEAAKAAAEAELARLEAESQAPAPAQDTQSGRAIRALQAQEGTQEPAGEAPAATAPETSTKVPDPQADKEATVRADAATMDADALRTAITEMERSLAMTEPQIKASRKQRTGKQSLIPMNREQLTEYYVFLVCGQLSLI